MSNYTDMVASYPANDGSDVSYHTHFNVPLTGDELQDLKNENEHLKELCMSMCQQLEDAVEHEVKDPDRFYRGINAVKELKEENKKLKEKVFDLEACDSELADTRLNEIINLEGRIKELENEKPYEELYKLQEEIDHKNKKFNEWIIENKELNEQLKESEKQRYEDNETARDVIQTLCKEKNNLKNELETKFKEKCKTIQTMDEEIKHNDIIMELLQKEVYGYSSTAFVNNTKIVDDIKKDYKEHEELKKLMDLIQKELFGVEYASISVPDLKIVDKIKDYKLYQECTKEKDKYEDILMSIQDELFGNVFNCHFNKLLDKIKEDKPRFTNKEYNEWGKRIIKKYGEEAECLEPQYYRTCDECETQLDINTPIFVFEKDDEDEIVMCGECGDDLHEEYKASGYTRDDSSEEETDDEFCPDCAIPHECESCATK